MDIPLHALPSHNKPTQLCHYAFITVLVQVCGLLNRTHKMKSGEAVSTFPDNCRLVSLTTSYSDREKQKGHTTGALITVVDRGGRV